MYTPLSIIRNFPSTRFYLFVYFRKIYENSSTTKLQVRHWFSIHPVPNIVLAIFSYTKSIRASYHHSIHVTHPGNGLHITVIKEAFINGPNSSELNFRSTRFSLPVIRGAGSYFRQTISITIQRGIVAGLRRSESHVEVFFL